MDPVALVGALAARGETLATAESLTGGMLAATLTSVPGASAVFVGGVVSYAASVKEDLLSVSAELIAAHGTVSPECAEAMALGARQRVGATWGLATTGVAGPDALEGHPVGTVYVGIAGPEGVESHLLNLSGDRAEIRRATCVAVLTRFAELLG